MKKLEKLKICEMQEYDALSCSEQIEMKGGVTPLPPWLVSLLIDIVGYSLGSGSGSGSGSSGGSGNTTNVNIQLGGTNNTISVNGQTYSVGDSIYVQAADSIANGTIYNPSGMTIYLGSGGQ